MYTFKSMYLSIGTYFIECKKCDRIHSWVYHHFLIGVLCTQYFLWTSRGGNEGSGLMCLVLRLWNEIRDKKHGTRPTCIYTHTQCILVYCTFGIYRALGLSDPRITGPSDCRIIGPSECRDPRNNGRTPLNLMHQSLLSQGKDGGKVKFTRVQPRVFKHHIYILTWMWP